MATPAGGSIPDHLRARRDAIAQQWYAAVRGSGYPLRSLPEVAASLGALTDQIITVLAATSLDDAQAEAIGAELAKLHAVQPAALGQTITVLGRELLAGLSPDQIATFAPQLAALLGALAAGFARQAQQTIRAEQETIAHMLFGALTQVDAELQSRDAQLDMVIHHAPLSLFTLDRAGVVQMAAGQGVTNLGLNAADIVGQSAFAIVRDLPAGQIRQIIDQALAGERFCRTLATGGRAFEVWYVPQYDQANTLQGVIGVALDITERHQAEAELLMVRRRLAEQAEEERRRLANALHDQAIQQLVQIGYQLDVVQRFVARGATPAEHNRTDLRPGLERIRQDVLAVAAELRDMSRTLRPAGLDELGLSIVLADWITRFQATAPPDLPAIHVNLDQCSVKLPELAALCLLRVAQEALRNVARHAQARQVTVTLRFEADAAVLQVADDGRGFTVPANLSDLARRSHYGLVSLAEQTTWAGGQFSIESQPGAGTVVTARAPLER